MIKAILYFVLWVLGIYVAVIYNSVSVIFLVGVGTILPLLLFVFLIYQCLSLKIIGMMDRQYLRPCDKEYATLRVLNRGIFPIKQIVLKLKLHNISTGERKKQQVKTAVPTKESEIIIPMQQISYGVWEISCTKIKVFDFLHFFSMKKRIRVEGIIVQMPCKYDINLRQLHIYGRSTEEQEEIVTDGYETDPTNIKAIREYQPQDKWKDIHWKLSSRRDQLMVKEYGPTAGWEVVLGLSMNGLDNVKLELIYSLIMGCLEKNIKLQVIWRGYGESQIFQYRVLGEEDAYYVMEAIMEKSVGSWLETEQPIGEVQLWIKDKILYRNGEEIQDFSKGSLPDLLLNMELIL